jgi:hypothetical protein
MLPDFGRLGVEEGEAVGDGSAVQVDELGDALGDPVGCPRDDDPRVALCPRRKTSRRSSNSMRLTTSVT